MSLGNMTSKRIREAFQGLIKQFQHRNEPLVFAVTNRYPTRVALYAAAFQGGWRVQFLKSLRQAAEMAREERPKAVFYDHASGDPAWDRYCSSLSGEGVPFVFLANRNDDQTFLSVLAAGGYHASGDPLRSEEIVKAVDFAGEVAALGHVPVM
jgi:hypothetical protein